MLEMERGKVMKVVVGFSDPGKQILRCDWSASPRSCSEQIFQIVRVCVVLLVEMRAKF